MQMDLSKKKPQKSKDVYENRNNGLKPIKTVTILKQ